MGANRKTTKRQGARLQLVLAGTLVFLTYACGKPVSVSVQLVPDGDPSVQLDREVTAEFGFANPIVWIVEARKGSIWTRPMLERVSELTREVFTLPSVVAPEVIGLASPNMRDVRVGEGSLDPVYLMASVPRNESEIAALRRRVESDPNYAGNLTNAMGTAALVVASFSSSADSDPSLVAGAALTLAEKYSDDQAIVHVVGAPVLNAQGLGLADEARTLRSGLWALAILFAAGATAVVALGATLAVVATLASMLGATACALLLLCIGALVLPWSIAALPLAAFIAAATAVARASGAPLPTIARMTLLIGLSSLTIALLAPAPTSALGIAFLAASLLAPMIGLAAARAVGVLRPDSPPENRLPLRVSRQASIVLLAIALAALPKLQASLGMPGHGERYFPGVGGDSLRAMRRLFPPPTTLAVRLRGEPGFIQEPNILQALDSIATAVRTEPGVRSVRSIADIVKTVNQVFNDGEPEAYTIPKEPGLAARLLSLAFSPSFRRFVDRGFTRAALWIELDTDDTSALARVAQRFEVELGRHPIPDARVDRFAGDGAILLVLAERLNGLLVSGVAAALTTAVCASVLLGWLAALRVLATVGATVLVGASGLAMFGLPIDLLSLPLLLASAGAAVALAALDDGSGEDSRRMLRLAAVFVAAGAALAVQPLTALRLAGWILAAPGVALLVCQARGARLEL